MMYWVKGTVVMWWRGGEGDVLNSPVIRSLSVTVFLSFCLSLYVGQMARGGWSWVLLFPGLLGSDNTTP